MLIPGSLRGRFRITSSAVLVALFIAAILPLQSQSPRVIVANSALDPSSDGSAADAGALPDSQPLHLSLRLTPSADRTAALDQLLAAQLKAGDPSYHQWLTPQQFAESYGATDDQIATVTTYLQSQGITVDSVSPSKTRLSLSGTTAQVQRAFAVSLRNYVVSGNSHYASSGSLSLPREVAAIVGGVSGLSDIPSPAIATVTSISPSGRARMIAPSAQPEDAFTAAASVVDDNGSPILAISTTACSTDLTQSDFDNYRALFRQASAQGITVVATSSCGTRGTGSFPGSLGEVTSVVTAPTDEPFNAIDPRPAWQSAPGLPDDGSRHEPDLTTTSLTDFTSALTTIQQQSGGRQGNINATLYALAPTPDLYTQPDNAPTGTWESSTGLGRVDLNTLIKVFPRGTTGTTTSLTASSYAVGYGTPITLTSTVTPSSFNTANPTGTVTFTSASQGTIGSSQLNNGTATFTVSNLGVGTYSVTANYSGDTNYAASASTSNVVITVSIVNATLTATISPSQNVPYGSTATVTATVALPNSSASPSGTVSAQIQGITGSVYSAVLSPNPGGNTATANINIDAPPPQTGVYTVQVTCAGNQNFQCQSPVNLTFTTTKGNTNTTISLTPSSPQAGEPVTITATINNNGNGKLNYTFNGSVTFFDNGKQLATSPVATNQATVVKTLSGNVLHSITAQYTGDSNWNGSTSTPLAVQPILLPSTMSVVANTSNTIAGINVTFTATVYTTASNAVGPTGTVTFYDTFNGTVVQLGVPATLVSNGPNQSIAIFSTTGLQAGTHSVYGIYNGDSNFSPATSSTYAITLTDFNLTFVPQTLTLHAGQTGQVVSLLGLVGGFTGTVSFGCTPPANAETTCSFSQVSLTGGGSTTLTIKTTAPVTQSSRTNFPQWSGVAGTVIAVLVWFVFPRRSNLPRLLAAIIALSLTANIGCGSGSSTSTDPVVTDPGTPLGTQIYTITAAGSDGVNTVRHTYQYQVTIQ
jgi:hypothetical protein